MNAGRAERRKESSGEEDPRDVNEKNGALNCLHMAYFKPLPDEMGHVEHDIHTKLREWSCLLNRISTHYRDVYDGTR